MKLEDYLKEKIDYHMRAKKIKQILSINEYHSGAIAAYQDILVKIIIGEKNWLE